jgi:hypothetical protein
MHAIYERITVAGPKSWGVRLTAAAYAHGFALALPEKVEMRARQVLDGDHNLHPSDRGSHEGTTHNRAGVVYAALAAASAGLLRFLPVLRLGITLSALASALRGDVVAWWGSVDLEDDGGEDDHDDVFTLLEGASRRSPPQSSRSCPERGLISRIEAPPSPGLRNTACS